MEVVCNNVLCRLEVHGSVISCSPLNDGETSDVETFTYAEITQLLRSRRDQGSAKIIVGSKTIIMRFVNPPDRERFIDKVQRLETDSGENEQWVASTICHTAVDFGLIDDAALKLLMEEEFPRGVVVAFDAIGSLVDPKTFKLRPITEQLENDIFRQIPILARIFERHVTDEETRQRFWEAVVRKYFCFSRTFLEEEIRELEADTTPSSIGTTTTTTTTTINNNNSNGRTTDTNSNGTSVVGGAVENLAGLNVLSTRALPKATALANHQLPHNNTQQPAAQKSHVRLFHGRPLTTHCVRRQMCDVSPPAPFVRVHPAPKVSRSLPKENTNREVLELLKRFWGGDTNQKKALRSKLNSVKVTGGGVLQRRCLQRAREYLEELESSEGK
ncbi:uncharacterized protein TM35_000064970 [Trypanosoma theileri]|uniref:TFIIH basal transcription factor subunit n=1 Tax=Trypanosoma theileri TaxID=67003 RepID=A0A1X0P3J0_9TRYP|nr:uncharacterized protein TM35_000064970 [Trypanosoma theileri]ORC91492.1 hypothetical protein TM35_000064970 [Trypanosoma theileri]